MSYNYIKQLILQNLLNLFLKTYELIKYILKNHGPNARILKNLGTKKVYFKNQGPNAPIF